MVDPQFEGGKPTMFICGNDDGAKTTVRTILDQFGWETEDMGKVEGARAIEPLSACCGASPASYVTTGRMLLSCSRKAESSVDALTCDEPPPTADFHLSFL